MEDTPPFGDGGDGASAQPVVSQPVIAEICSAQPAVTPRGEHCVSRRDIDPDALKVLYRLSRNNYIAYLVGGGVRDLLLGRRPKDFDVSTNARPEQIRALFRNCILIGRRFRLAHVRYGDKIIETSTFRSTPKLPANPDDPEADLFQRDDNMFGTPAEDAFRRDFTVNGLFYDIESFSIIDYVGGLEDLAAKRIRCIGDPNIRFREDPVRMVRAIRFASRLNFTLDPETEDAIRRHGEELTKASPARLLEEITRLFAFSSGEKAVRLLHSTGLLRVILPEVSAFLDAGADGDDGRGRDIFWRRLRALDTGDTVLPEGSPSLIFAVLFLDALKANLRRDWTFATTPKLRFDRVHAFLDPLSVRLRFPRKLVDRIVHMYINQSRFAGAADKGKKGSLTNFVTQESFHESLALAEIVLTSEDGDQTLLNHWRDLLAERIFGRDDGQPDRERHGEYERGGRDRDRDRDRRHDRHAAHAAPEAEAEPENNETHEDGHEKGDPSGHKLSRSARRRRNKRLRRQQEPGENRNGNGNGAQPAQQQEQERPKTRGAVFAAEASAPAEPVKDIVTESKELASDQEKPSRRGRGGRKPAAKQGARQTGHAAPATPAPAPESAAVPAEPPKPLTAAAFWTEPEPEPVPEPEPEPEKKPRGRRKSASPKSKDKESSAEDAAGAAEPPKRKPLPMDRADEADIPISWMDEI